MKRLSVVFLIALCAASASGQQLWSGFLSSVPSTTLPPPAGSAIPWDTGAGIPGGIPSAFWTQSGSTITATGSDQTSQIQTALNGCGTNHYVLLAAGTFTINTNLAVTSNCTLRGMGADQTFLSTHGTSIAPITLGSGGVSFAGPSITGGATAGSTSITLSSASGISNATLLVISETNGSWVTIAGGEGNCTWCDGWSTNGNRARGQIVEVKNVSGNNLTIDPPLYSAYINSPVATPFTPAATHAGVENLQILQNATTYSNGVYMSKCAYCWASGIEVNYAPGNSTTTSNFLEIDWGYRDMVVDSYFSNAYDRGVGVDTVIFPVYKTSASVIQNNIIERGHDSIIVNWGAAGNVIAYNFTHGELNSTGQPGQTLTTGLDNFVNGGIVTHGAHPQFNLFEGNSATRFSFDQVWGSSSNNTVHRNLSRGTTVNCNPVTGRGPVVCAGAGNSIVPFQDAIAFDVSHLSWYYNFLNNVAGSALQQGISGSTHVAISKYPANRGYDHQTNGYTFGYGESSDSGPGSSAPCANSPCDSTDAFNTALIFNDYTLADGALQCWLSGSSSTCTGADPASYYLSAKPSWWGSLPWPAIGSDVSGGTGPGGHTSSTDSNPASRCFFDVMGGDEGGTGTPLPFNAARCYSFTTPTAAAPTCSPGGGVFGTSQTVTCSVASVGAIQCRTTDGTTPATNGTTGCTNGTLVSGSFVVSSGTLRVIAGGTGYLDGPIARYIFSVVTGGPVIYSARALLPDGTPDTCVHGLSPNPPNVAPFYNPAFEKCLFPPGSHTGQPGSALVFQEGPSDPLPFNRLDAGSNPALMNTSFTDPDFGSYWVFATDASTPTCTPSCVWPGTQNTTRYIMGSDGAYDATGLGTANDVMFTFQNNGSVPFLAHLIESRFLAHQCSIANPCVIPSAVAGNITCTPSATSYTSPSCTHTQISSGAVAFSRSPADPPNTSYEMHLPQVFQDGFTEGLTGGLPNGTDSVTRTLKVDFSSDAGGPCHIVPSDYVSTWNGQFAVDDLGRFNIGSGGGGSYQTIIEHPNVATGSGSTLVVTGNDVFIMPVLNQPAGGHWMFQYSGGTTSGTEPNWAAATTSGGCPAVGNVCVDGTGFWTNIGKVNGQGAGFDVFHFDPADGCTYINTRLARSYRGNNEGPLWPAVGTPRPSGQQLSDDTTTCYRMNGTGCGSGGVVNFTDLVTLHAISTPFNGRYSRMEPTDTGPLTSPSYSCTTGSVQWTQYQTWPDMRFVSGHTYALNKYVASPVDHNYYKLTTALPGTTPTYTTDPSGDAAHWTLESNNCYGYFYDFDANMVRPSLELGPDYGADGHGQQGFGVDFHGTSLWTKYLSQPNCQSNTIAGCDGLNIAPGCSVVVPNNNYVGAPYPGCRTLPTSLDIPGDFHPTGRNFGVLDLQPLIFFTDQVPSYGGTNLPGSATQGPGVGGYYTAGYNEILGLTMGGAPSIYRFGHNFCSGSNASFSISSCIGVVAQTGKWALIGSDFMNTRGDQVTGSTTCAHPLRGQYGPVVSQTVAFNDSIYPVTNNQATGQFNIYQAVGFYSGTYPSGSYITTGTGAEGTALPAWGSAATDSSSNFIGCPVSGQYCTTDHGNNPATSKPLDGNILWLNQGPNTCNSSIAIIDLTSANTGTTLQIAPSVMFSRLRNPF